MKRQPARSSQPNYISMGVELESYSIALPENRICRELHFPKRASIEKGERFVRDWSIGSEYNSKPFKTIREAFFLLKSGLRKYTSFRDSDDPKSRHVIFPIGGWSDRFAGSHFHLAQGLKGLTYTEALKLSQYLHDHIPFIIVLMANSPVWRNRLTPYPSNRLRLGSDKYFKVTKREMLYKHHFRELTYNQGNKKKPPTLELRIADSSIPEFMIAGLCVCRAVAARWLKKKSPLNLSTNQNYLKSRDQAVRFGLNSRIAWSNHWIKSTEYVDLFFRKYDEELRRMDIPDDIIRVFKYLKKGWNQAEVIRRAVENCRKRHRPTWERRFAKKYAGAIVDLLDGNSFERFASHLGVRLPNIDRVWLGRKGSRW